MVEEVFTIVLAIFQIGEIWNINLSSVCKNRFDKF